MAGDKPTGLLTEAAFRDLVVERLKTDERVADIQLDPDNPLQFSYSLKGDAGTWTIDLENRFLALGNFSGSADEYQAFFDEIMEGLAVMETGAFDPDKIFPMARHIRYLGPEAEAFYKALTEDAKTAQDAINIVAEFFAGDLVAIMQRETPHHFLSVSKQELAEAGWTVDQAWKQAFKNLDDWVNRTDLETIAPDLVAITVPDKSWIGASMIMHTGIVISILEHLDTDRIFAAAPTRGHLLACNGRGPSENVDRMAEIIRSVHQNDDHPQSSLIFYIEDGSDIAVAAEVTPTEVIINR
ncbi:MAG: hypothetical protein AAGF59_10285 [Pseudomonadota bacterium]